MAGAGIAAAAIDFFYDDRGFGKLQTRAAIFLGNQGGQPTGLGKGVDEGFGIAPFFVNFSKLFAGKLGA